MARLPQCGSAEPPRRGQGGEPICRWLGVSVPAEAPEAPLPAAVALLVLALGKLEAAAALRGGSHGAWAAYRAAARRAGRLRGAGASGAPVVQAALRELAPLFDPPPAATSEGDADTDEGGDESDSEERPPAAAAPAPPAAPAAAPAPTPAAAAVPDADVWGDSEESLEAPSGAEEAEGSDESGGL
eukprot:TRINITY_DN8291_c1_g3_i1.p2 TRINITY_DN8291_c1_g3~~TRINITY_DN8291_c1_g3_i1.p2  ORF type:complete len:186 (+),score=62.14 TRINITY_DN8291_c1_g3_i1:1444-2001(+)